MEHVVFFPAPDGSPAFRRVASLDEAVRLVEHLRNVEGVASVSVHALTEVPLAFRAYYRVEVPAGAVPVQQQAEVGEDTPVTVAPEAGVETPALALVEDVPVDEPEPVLVASSAPVPASLGFFA